MPNASPPQSTRPPRAPRGVRKRLCACIMRHFAAPHERLIAPHKRALLAGLRGHIVEIGPGSGANLPYLTPAGATRYTAIEPNAYLHAPLVDAAAAHDIPIDLRPTPIGPGRADLPDACADAVICTLVLCSVPDQRTALDEITRLLRPGGRFVFLEHVGATRGTLLRALQRTVRPLWRIPGDGCEPDRDTAAAIIAAAPGRFEQLHMECFALPVPVIAPHIAGAAIRTADA